MSGTMLIAVNDNAGRQIRIKRELISEARRICEMSTSTDEIGRNNK